MRDLNDFGLKGRLPHFIDNFLSNSNFKVRVETTLSDLQGQEEGIPHDRILSVTLFSIKINNIVKALNLGVDCSMYVEDFVICCRSKHFIPSDVNFSNVSIKFKSGPWRTVLNSPRAKLNICIFANFGVFTMIQSWSWRVWRSLWLTSINVYVSSLTRIWVLFRILIIEKPSAIKLFNSCVLLHIRIGGAEKSTFLKFCRPLVRSKLDYGCFICGSAKKSYLRCLDSIQHLVHCELLPSRVSLLRLISLRWASAGGASTSILYKTSIQPIQPCIWMHH